MNARTDAYIPALQYGTGTYIQPAFNTLVIPEFSYTNSYIVSAILAEYAVGNSSAFSIRLPLEDNVVDAESFALCARYTENGQTYRYVLHKPAWFGGILFPAYTGQKLGPSAYLEIWSLDDLTPAEVDGDINLRTGPLTFQAPGQIATCGQIQGTTTTLAATII